jgi:Tol biopolymer transport system component
MGKFLVFSIFLGLLIPVFLSAQNTKRPIAIDDIYRMEKVGSPEMSSDGKWIAYTVTSIDKAADRRRTALWMVNWEGTEDVRLTFGKQSASSPKWSPDGKYLSFLSSDGEKGKAQVWLLDRRGGAPQPLTSVKQDIEDFNWSPDAKKIVLEMSEDEDAEAADNKDGEAAKVRKPIVLDRYHFKHDVGGYMTAASRTHLYLFDVESKKLDTLTSDKNFEDAAAEWSPDSKQIAYVSNHEQDPDQSPNDEIYVMDAHAGAIPRKIASFYSGSGERLSWSPDGKLIAYVVGADSKYNAYSMNRLAVVSVSDGASRMLTEKFDRGISAPKFTTDGSAIDFLVPDDRSEYMAKISTNGGNIDRHSARRTRRTWKIDRWRTYCS